MILWSIILHSRKKLIFLQLRVWEGKFPWNSFANTCQFPLIFHQDQVIFIHYKTVLDEDDNGKFRLERVKLCGPCIGHLLHYRQHNRWMWWGMLSQDVPGKLETLTQYCFDVGPPSLTSAQPQNNIGSMSCICWVHGISTTMYSSHCAN